MTSLQSPSNANDAPLSPTEVYQTYQQENSLACLLADLVDLLQELHKALDRGHRAAVVGHLMDGGQLLARAQRALLDERGQLQETPVSSIDLLVASVSEYTVHCRLAIGGTTVGRLILPHDEFLLLRGIIALGCDASKGAIADQSDYSKYDDWCKALFE